jgi:hypothetical protein
MSRVLKTAAGLTAAVVVLGAGTAATVGFGGRKPAASTTGTATPATAEVRRQTLADQSKQD